MKSKRVTIVELRRMKELADEFDLPCGSVAKIISREFGTERTAHDVRMYLHRNFGRRSQRRAA